MPIRRSYYRASPAASVVVRCPDSGAGCGNENECNSTTSGCRGGNNWYTACQPGLSGTFCELCDDGAFGGAKVYYVAATDSDFAHCRVWQRGGNGNRHHRGLLFGGFLLLSGIGAAVWHELSTKRRHALSDAMQLVPPEQSSCSAASWSTTPPPVRS